VYDNDQAKDLKPSIKVKTTRPTLAIYSDNGDNKGLIGTTDTDTVISPKSRFSNNETKNEVTKLVPLMTQVEASKRLLEKNNLRLAAYSLAYNAENQDASSQLYPMAPAFKELS